MGPLMFFPLTAIQSVPFLIIAICLAIRGLIFVPEKKDMFKSLLIFYGIYVVVFFYPIVSYTWMSFTDIYGSIYHTLGFGMSILIVVSAYQVARKYYTTWPGLGKFVYLGCWAFQLTMINQDMFASSHAPINYLLYGIYALSQVIVPVFVAAHLLKQKKILTEHRAVNPPPPIAPAAPNPQGVDNPFRPKE